MPVVIKTNSDGSLSITGKAQKSAKSTPKFYNNKLTGSETSRTRGYFNAQHHTIAQVENELDNIAIMNHLRKRQYINTIDNQYLEIPIEKYPTFTFKNRTHATLTPSLTLIANKYPDAKIELNKDTIINNLVDLPRWDVIYESNDLNIYGSVHISEIVEYHSKDDDKKVSKFEFIPEYTLCYTTGSIDNLEHIYYIHKDRVETNNSNQLLINSTVQTNPTEAYLVSNCQLSELFVKDHIEAYDINKNIEKLDELSIAQMLANQATDLINNKMETVIDFFEIIKDNSISNNKKYPDFELIKAYILRLSQFDYKDKKFFSTSDITTIYNEVEKLGLTQRDTDIVLRQNIRILLASNIEKLNQIKPQIYKPQLTADEQQEWINTKAKWVQNQNYSQQQLNIILSEEPFTIAQAGAGSGKSHTVVGRLNYLKEQKQKLENVLVLSFTNAAADNIKERFPNIQSETLARMFDNIHQTHYPKQKLSDIETVHNTLKLININNPVFQNIPHDEIPQTVYDDEAVNSTYQRFLSILSKYVDIKTSRKRIDQNYVTSQLINLIRDRKNVIERFLDSIGQTALEIEPIIIHHHLSTQHKNLKIPKQYQNIHYIITDESQDISTFEYSLLLEFVYINKAQFLIVGDGSQTLYEFRSSDPRYMNALEASGVFETRKLETNYRSHQAILSYANEFLKVIEANDIAKIQLRSNIKTTLTEQDIDDRITISDVTLMDIKSQEEQKSAITNLFKNQEFKSYILQKYNAGEQVAFMAWRKLEVNALNEALTEFLKENNIDEEIALLSKSKPNIPAIWTKTLTRAIKNIRNIQPNTNYTYNLRIEIENAFEREFKHRTERVFNFLQSKLLGTLKTLTDSPEYKHTLNHAIAQNNNAGLNRLLMNYFIAIEKKEISTSQYLNSREKPDVANKKFILSTIHSIKGFEFDNAIIIHNNTKMPNAGNEQQQMFRMLFVALSRAKKSEYIVNIKSNYMPTIDDTSIFKEPIHTADYLVRKEINAVTP